MKIEVVIGANYGDEGKGLLTEYLCRSRPKPLVMLSNGGCQRGHTVNNAEHRTRHVFHNFGSGTLVGAPTLLSKSFLMNPISFASEWKELSCIGVQSDAHRMPGCIIQLPSDMFINQQLEKHRSESRKKHGSCGWGIWETKFRNMHFKPLAFDDFFNMSAKDRRACMKDVFEWQVEHRLKPEGADDIDKNVLDVIESDGFFNHFMQDVNFMNDRCSCIENDNALEFASNAEIETIIVENAQGLLLDMKYAPVDENGRRDIHVTPSKTGLEGALESFGTSVNIDNVVPNYVSRSYITRHGAGPFPEEMPGLEFEDMTNVHNEYQDSIRFGKITYDVARSILERISADAHSCDCVPRLAVTHLNEARCMLLEENANFMSYDDDSSKMKVRQQA